MRLFCLVSAAAAVLVLGAGAPLAFAQFDPNVNVTGTIVDEFGRPATGEIFPVGALPPSGPLQGSQTDQQGHFQIALPAGVKFNFFVNSQLTQLTQIPVLDLSATAPGSAVTFNVVMHTRDAT